MSALQVPDDHRLLERLRARIQRSYVGPGKFSEILDPLCQQAADEIAKLRSKVEELEQIHG